MPTCSANTGAPGTRTSSAAQQLHEQAERLNPDSWVTDDEVTRGPRASTRRVLASLRDVVGRRRRRRKRPRAVGRRRPATRVGRGAARPGRDDGESETTRTADRPMTSDRADPGRRAPPGQDRRVSRRSASWFIISVMRAVSRRQARCAFALALTMAGVAVAGAGSARRPDFTSRVELVTTDVVVRDNSGQFIADLKKDDFEVLEDGVLRRSSRSR